MGWGDLSNPAHQFSPVNPIAISQLVTNTNTRKQFLGGLNLGLTLAKGLVARTSFNTNLGFGNSTYYQPTYSIGWAVKHYPYPHKRHHPKQLLELEPVGGVHKTD
jgi:hypothetical protein